jgi:hypothetical protein
MSVFSAAVNTRYVLAALAFGPVWFLVLQLPSLTRHFIAGAGRVRCLLVLSAVSLLVAWSLRRFVREQENDVWLAIFAPYYGALLFGLSLGTLWWVESGFRTLSYWDQFVLLPLWSVLTALVYFLLVIPTGYLAQRVMRWASSGSRRPHHVAGNRPSIAARK